MLDSSADVPESWGRFAPKLAMRDWTSRLAEPFPADSPGRSARLRFQVLDLLHELSPIEPAEPDAAEIEHLKAEIEADDDTPEEDNQC